MTVDNFKLLTARLELRPHRFDDVDFMMELNLDPEVTRYVPDGPFEHVSKARGLIESLRAQFAERKIGRFLVIEKATGKKLGWCGLKWIEETKEIDLGYRFLRSSWGKGFAFEAAQACLSYGFNALNFEKITAQIMPTNTASIALAKKLRMKEASRVIEDDVEFIVFEIQSSKVRTL
ncbi:GNAT family N-acetyltransferase [Bdellovibrio svalbardensis]|uniref:GNAT family N-acetyltransferase n=1 Tax=Bdellovibrio svalbardensis TaxID=2972972 RepID=A0ABT6DIN1_9BACT|nr:GNAT family N-acetyltransferase [Bdellovibrio svalbardensis]MDG0816712.1 GNAT family N-acetyltransferase [Bdellovibrio svalbardensis]